MNRFGWMLVKDKFWESYETNRLIEEFQKQDIEIQLVDPNTIDIFVNKDNKKSILVNGEESDLPKFVFPRTGSGTSYYIKAVIRHFERMGVPVINTSDSIDNVKDNDKLKPAFLVFSNYERVLTWNRSLRFAIAVCTLKDKFENEL